MQHVTYPTGAAPIGIGLRAPHVSELIAARPALNFVEVHAENYMTPGPALDRLLEVRRDYALSLHGVGASLGSAEGLDPGHLARFKMLVDLTQPILISEHLAWSAVDGVYLNDLLPLPYTDESLGVVAANVAGLQEALGRRVLVENPSRYLRFRDSPIPEAEFLAELVRRTECRLLLDVNNLFVSGANVGERAGPYLAALPPDAIGEIHLAGHACVERGGQTLLIDDHGAPVCDGVWTLFHEARRRFGDVPSLVERDKNLPALQVLTREAGMARYAGTRIHALAS